MDLVVLTESLECGVEVLVRLKALRKEGRLSLANNTIESPNIASNEHDTSLNVVNTIDSKICNHAPAILLCAYHQEWMMSHLDR